MTAVIGPFVGNLIRPIGFRQSLLRAASSAANLLFGLHGPGVTAT
jgi:predicted xylose isomerase-like sugar epimerase